MSIADRLSALSPEQRALFEKLREQKKQKSAAPRAPHPPQPPPIPRRGPGEHWPLSFDQERLWFLYMLSPGDTAYNIDTASRIRGPLDIPALEEAFQELARRHEIWRTAFPAVDGRPVQVVLPEMRLPTGIVDLRGLEPERREATARRLVVETTRVPFAMETGPLVRALLIRLGDDDCLVELVVHHIVTDWVTFQLFWRELGALYEAFTARRASPLPPPVVQYADYTAWHREWMRGEVEQYFLRYWLEHLRDAPLALELPTDRPRPPVMTSRGAQVPVRIERAADLKTLARREGLTPFMALLAAWQLVLARWSGEDQVIVGSPNANRNRSEIQEIFGFFLTQIPFCTDFSGDPALREALVRTRDVALAAYAHQDLPFGKLVEALHPERDLARAPIIQVILLLLDGAVLSPRLADLEVTPLTIHDGNARYDLMLATWDLPDLIQGWCEYNADLWDDATVLRMIESLVLMVDAIVAGPERRLSDVVLLAPAERRQVLEVWSGRAAAGEPAGDLPSVPRRVADRAAERPGAVAVEGEDGTVLTYADLERRAARIAAGLRGMGVKRGDRVGVRLPRTPDLVAALLGVWRAGAAYVPLDPEAPEERLRLILEEAGAAALVADPLPDGEALPDLPAQAPEPAEIAYVLFTSGSTGRPKGVEVTHGALARLVDAMIRLHGLGPSDAWLAATTIAFDIATAEVFLPLATGGRVLLASRETAVDGTLLARALETRGATHFQATPATWSLLLEAGWPGRPGLFRISTGEALSRELADRLLALPGGPLWNQYGPTETTIWSTVERVAPDRRPAAAEPIGRPVAGTVVRVLGRDLCLVPVGAVGELFLAGAGLAQGYLGRPGLTAERFLPDPLSAEPGGRLYRTGDLVRWLPDGRLEYRGRSDHQIKLRGFRIELGEIEAVLRGLPSLRQAAVVLQRRAEGPRLLAAVVPSETASARDLAALRAELRRRLPEAMVPSAFAVLDALPLTPSGKVDRKALERLEPAAPMAGGAAPEGADQELLARLWSQVLGREEIGAADDFFALGGHSLLATRLTLAVRDVFGVDLPVRAIFQAPTLAAQAELIAARRAGGALVESAPIRPLPRGKWPLVAPLSFAQERLWFLDRLMPGSPAYNLAVALRLDGPLDAAALAGAFRRLAERHETLRTALPERSLPGGEMRPVQEVAESPGLALQEIDLSASPDPATDARRLAEADALRPFDLAAGPLLRATLLALGPERHVLLLAMHHIVSDAWSMGVLVEDLTALYAGRPLPDLPVQYADYAVWQRERLTGAETDRQLAFWREQLAGAPRLLDLPTDRPRPPVQSLRGGTVPFALDAAATAALGDLARRRGASLYMAVLAGWGTLLGRLADQQDLVTGTAVANRDRPEVERLIGFFVNTLALRIDLDGSPAFGDLVGRLRQRVLDAFSHRDLPFEKLVEELHPARDRSRQPLFQALLTFQNVPQGRVDLPGLALTPLEIEGQTAKFDLTLTLFEQEGRLVGRLEYAADLFDRATAERWAGGFGRLLAAAAAAPQSRAGELPLLTEAERRQLLAVWNREAQPPSADRGSLPHRFEEQVDRAPDAPALSLDGERLTYRELDERASRLARHLRALGVRPGDRVALCLDRSFDLVAALLAVLKTGAAYLPLDPAWPAERLRFALEDSGAALVLTAGEPAGDLTAGLPVRALPLDRAADEIARQDAARLGLEIDPELPAYVIYTSGSTGRPKGVVVPHGNVTRLFAATAPWFGFGPGDVWTLFHSCAFDFSVWEIWGALLHGGRLVIVPFRVSREPDAFLRLLAEEGVTVLNQTPSAFGQLGERGAWGEGLRDIIFGGEALDPAMLAPWLAGPSPEGAGRPRFINMYGITETTVHVTFRPLTGADAAAGGSPVGVPIPDLTVHVLDRSLGLQPVGIPGEICVGGEGLAQGYLNRPDLTAGRFVPDPYGPPGSRLYRSGDLGRWRPGGDLEVLGRIDRQVKIRGFRIEPGEIEAALARHPAVRRAAVLPRDNPQDRGGRTLVAYTVLAEPVPAADLQRFLRQRLPEALIPAAWVFLDDLPLTPNGKVDRRALAALEVEPARASSGFVPPRTPLEERLAAAMAGVLGLAPERIGVYDNFFDLGGHSLLATQLVAQLRLQHGLEVPLSLLFDSAHLADLGDQITARELAAADEALLEEMLAELEGTE